MNDEVTVTEPSQREAAGKASGTMVAFGHAMRRPLFLLALVACRSASVATPPTPAAVPEVSRNDSNKNRGYVQRLQEEAKVLGALVTSPLAHRFLDATRTLPTIRSRRVYRNRDKSHFYSARQAEALPADVRGALVAIEVDEERYYEAEVVAPLHFARPLDVALSRGLTLEAGSRVLDFGYGSIGHLRLLASLGLDVTGIDVRQDLALYYGEPGDTGSIAVEGGGTSGLLRVLHGSFPSDAKLREEVGAGYDLVVSKNTLKKGYIHPDRPAPDKSLFRLGVDDATFLATFHDLLKPGGRMLLYNIFIPVPSDEPFLPMSDGRSPFSRSQWEAAGFDVEAFDEDDTAAVRPILAVGDDHAVASKCHSLFTLVRRRP